MIRIRAKKLRGSRYSLFLDYNTYITQVNEQGEVRRKRKLEYLSLYVSKDYTATHKKTGRPIHKKIERQDKETWELAQMICRKRELMFLNHDQELIRQDRRDESFLEFFTTRLKQETSKQNSSYQGAFLHLNRFSQGKLSFREVTLEWLFEFRKYLLQRVSKSTAQIYLDRIKIIFAIACKLKIVRENPFTDLGKLKYPKKDPTFLVLNELKVLKEHQPNFHPVITNAFFFACQTGLRYSDVSTLTWTEVSMYNYLCQKTKKREKLYLSPLAEGILLEQRQREEGGLVFPLINLTRTNNELRRWTKAAGILKHVTFHVSRHTCATLLISSGVDIYTVSKILGHSSVKTTEVYAQVLDDKKIEAVKRLPKF